MTQRLTFTITRTPGGALLTRDDGHMLAPAVRDIVFQDSGIAMNYVRHFHGAAAVAFTGYGAPFAAPTTGDPQ